MSKKMNGSSRGGKRKNAGRKKTGELVETVVMRVPKGIRKDIDVLIKRYINSKEYHENIKKSEVRNGQKIVIILSYWNNKKKTYDNHFLLRKVTIVKESYFETENNWRFGRIGITKDKVFEHLCKEYHYYVELSGKPDLVRIEQYDYTRHKNIDFL